MVRLDDLRTFHSLLTRFLRPYWRMVLVVFALTTAAGFIKGLQPLVFAPVIETFTGTASEPARTLSEINLNNIAPTIAGRFGMDITRKWQVILFGISFYLGTAVLAACLSSGAFVLSLRTRLLVSRDTMTFLHRHLLTLPLEYFNRKKTGDFISRLTNDAVVTANSLDTIVLGVMQSLAELFIYGYMLFRTDGLLSLAVLTLGSAHLLITRLLASKVRSSTRRAFSRRGYLSHQLLESIQGMRVIKSFSSERFESKRVAEAIESFQSALKRERLISFVENPVRQMTDAVLLAAALALSYWAYSHGRLQMGGFVLYMGLCTKAIIPISKLSREFLQLNKSVGGACRVNEVLNYTSPLKDGSRESRDLREAIELRSVSFAYGRGGRKALDGVSLRIGKGEKVALVGPSGSGKSTLVDLVLRLYDPTEGVILYDGIDIREFRQREYRKNFGVVAQESLLFHMSLKENIAYSRKADERNLARAAAVANAREFIDEMPEGLDTVVGDRGVLLSGGQRQRIAIARAVYGEPSILILDEATSALDSKSELEVQKAIDTAIEGMTAIVIAHRLSTVAHADRIVVMKEGRVEAQGTHKELLESSPTYRLLYELQYSGREEGFGS